MTHKKLAKRKIWGTSFRLYIFFLITILFLHPGQNAASAETDEYNVLIVNSYHQGFGWTDAIVSAIKNEFSKTDLPVEFYIEYMDTKRYPPQDVFPQISSLYQSKYDPENIDVIIVTDDNAFNFMLNYGDELFGDTPIVFCAVNKFADEQLEGRTNITGVIEDFVIKDTLDLALSLHPDTKTIAIVTDSTPTDEANRERIDLVKPLYDSQVNFIDLIGLPASELQQAVLELPSNSIILFLNLYRDQDGKFYTLEESVHLVSEISLVPTYSLWKDKVETGIMGGIVISPEPQGETAASMAIQILKGKPVSELPVLQESPNLPVFNYEQLRKFGVPLHVLPSDRVIVNQPDTLFFRYRTWIIGVTGFLLFQTSLIVLLIVSNVRRRRAEEELRLSEQRLLAFNSASIDGILLYDADLRLLEINQAALMPDVSKSDLIGKHMLEISPNLEGTGRYEKYKKVIETGEPIRFSYLQEMPDFPDRHLSLRAFKVNDGLGIIFTDISEILNAQNALRALNRQLEQMVEKRTESLILANKNLEQFALSVAHHIKSPIRAIKKFVDMLMTDFAQELGEKPKKLLNYAEENIDLLDDYLSGLSEFSKKNQQKIEKKEVNLNAVVDHVVKEYESVIHRKGIHFQIDSLPNIVADPYLVREVFYQLIDNAVKYSSTTDVPEISISSEKIDGTIKIQIKDNGIGFDMAYAEQLFRIFHRLHGDDYEGLGVGLAIVHNILHRHHGSIEIQSSLGQGTKVSFSFE